MYLPFRDCVQYQSLIWKMEWIYDVWSGGRSLLPQSLCDLSRQDRWDALKVPQSASFVLVILYTTGGLSIINSPGVFSSSVNRLWAAYCTVYSLYKHKTEYEKVQPCLLLDTGQVLSFQWRSLWLGRENLAVVKTPLNKKKEKGTIRLFILAAH